jgi:hypothetical protein
MLSKLHLSIDASQTDTSGVLTKGDIRDFKIAPSSSNYSVTNSSGTLSGIPDYYTVSLADQRANRRFRHSCQLKSQRPWKNTRGCITPAKSPRGKIKELPCLRPITGGS